MQRNAIVFYNFYNKLDQLTPQERQESGIDIDRMAELFKNSKDSLKKFLSLAQYSELMLRADSLVAFATGSMFDNGAFPSLDVGAAAAAQPLQLEAFRLDDV